MTRDELLNALRAAAENPDTEVAHLDADNALLAHIAAHYRKTT